MANLFSCLGDVLGYLYNVLVYDPVVEDVEATSSDADQQEADNSPLYTHDH